MDGACVLEQPPALGDHRAGALRAVPHLAGPLMNPFPVLIPVALATLLTALVITGWMLVRAEQRVGALQQAMNTCTTRLKELNEAHRERDKIDGQNRALSDDDLFRNLLR